MLMTLTPVHRTGFSLLSFCVFTRAWSLITSRLQRPCIPYLGCYLGDLTFVDEGNPDMVDGLINFEKRLDIWRYIQEVESYKKEPFQWPQVEPLHSLLTSLPAFGDKELYGLSLMVEKRVAK